MKVILVFVLAVTFIASISAQQKQGCYCPAEYRPFCGTDEVTYSNKCELNCAQQRLRSLRVKFEGVCAVPYVPDQPKKEVPKYYKPAPPPPPPPTYYKPAPPPPPPPTYYKPAPPPPPPPTYYKPPPPKYYKPAPPPPPPPQKYQPTYGKYGY